MENKRTLEVIYGDPERGFMDRIERRVNKLWKSCYSCLIMTCCCVCLLFLIPIIIKLILFPYRKPFKRRVSFDQK